MKLKIESKIIKKVTIPLLTLAFILTSQAPGVSVEKIILDEGKFDKAIVQIYTGEKLAAAPLVDYNQVPKNYEVKVYVNNAKNEIKFTADSGRPFIALDRTFVPYRVMSEALGAKVDWDNTDRKVTAEGNNSVVELFIGNQNYKVNGKSKQMDVEPFILSAEGRTYIPARYLTEGLNYTIDFAQYGKVMYIVSFTQGQTEAERKAVLNELVKSGEQVKPPVQGIKSIGEIKGGKLTEEQARQLQKNIDSIFSAAKLEWRDWPENDKYHKDFERAIKEARGQNTIVDHRLFAKDRRGVNQYFVIESDGTVRIVEVGFRIDGTPDVGATGFVPNAL